MTGWTASYLERISLLTAPHAIRRVSMPPSSGSDEQALMLQFALWWYPYGGGSAEDIFIKFGLSEKAYFQRLSHVLCSDRYSISPATRKDLHAVCERRLQARGVACDGLRKDWAIGEGSDVAG